MTRREEGSQVFELIREGATKLLRMEPGLKEGRDPGRVEKKRICVLEPE